MHAVLREIAGSKSYWVPFHSRRFLKMTDKISDIWMPWIIVKILRNNRLIYYNARSVARALNKYLRGIFSLPRFITREMNAKRAARRQIAQSRIHFSRIFFSAKFPKKKKNPAIKIKRNSMSARAHFRNAEQRATTTTTTLFARVRAH